MKKIYTASLPNSAALRADSGQLGTEILMPASSIGIPQKYTTILTPAQLLLAGTQLIPISLPNSAFVLVAGFMYYERGGFDDFDANGTAGVFTISSNNGNTLTKQDEISMQAGNMVQLVAYPSATTSQGGQYSLIFDSSPTNTNLGRLQVTLYVIPLDLAIP